MNQHKTILFEIENMVREKQIPIEKLPHLIWIEQRAKGKHFSTNEHIRALVYSMLSNNRPWEPIEKNIDAIDTIFFQYDKDALLAVSPDSLIEQILSIKCGNRNIKNQMHALPENIRKFERIEKEFGSLDNFVTSGTPLEIADLLANSIKYKLQTLGFALAMEYLRNVGIDAIKPDTHIRRILGSNRLGCSNKPLAGELEAVEIINKISAQTGISPSKIDAILWLFCSNDNAMICTEQPHCKQCTLRGRFCNQKYFQ